MLLNNITSKDLAWTALSVDWHQDLHASANLRAHMGLSRLERLNLKARRTGTAETKASMARSW